MRLQTTITDLTENQWNLVQRVLLTSYDIPHGASRVCLVIEHNGEERHSEMPSSSFVGLVLSLGLANVVQHMTEVAGHAAPDLTPPHIGDPGHQPSPYADPVRPYGYDKSGGIVALDQNGLA